MGTTVRPELLVLHALKVKGFAAPESVADGTALPLADVDRILAGLGDRDLANHRTGRISGWSLTPAGRAAHAERLAAELAEVGCRDTIEETYDEFLGLNEAVKMLCTDWQLRPIDGGDSIPNDHTNQAYDLGIVERLIEIHESVVPLCQRLSIMLVRYAPYRGRFDRAYRLIKQGDRDALTRPLSGSYHDVWMELHEDLLLTLGRKRSRADGN